MMANLNLTLDEFILIAKYINFEDYKNVWKNESELKLIKPKQIMSAASIKNTTLRQIMLVASFKKLSTKLSAEAMK